MDTQFAEILALEKRAGRGGIIWQEPIVRGLPFQIVLPIPADVTGDAFKMGFCSVYDQPALVTITGSVGTFDNGVTDVTFDLSAAQVATITTARSDDDLDGVAEVLADILYQQGSTGDWRRASLFAVPISGKVTDD